MRSSGGGVLLRLFAAVIGVRWLTGLPRSKVGFFGGKAWWKDQRQVHGALWTGYALTQDARFLKSDELGSQSEHFE